jgi:hypothetical protein
VDLCDLSDRGSSCTAYSPLFRASDRSRVAVRRVTRPVSCPARSAMATTWTQNRLVEHGYQSVPRESTDRRIDDYRRRCRRCGHRWRKTTEPTTLHTRLWVVSLAATVTPLRRRIRSSGVTITERQRRCPPLRSGVTARAAPRPNDDTDSRRRQRAVSRRGDDPGPPRRPPPEHVRTAHPLPAPEDASIHSR